MADFSYLGVTAVTIALSSLYGNGDRVTQVVVETTSQGSEPAARATQVAVETASTLAVWARVTQIVVETLDPAPECEEPQEPEDLAQAVGPVLWVEWDPGDGSGVRPFGEVHLPDPNAYYYGDKPARLLGADAFRRALAGPTFDYEVGRFRVTIADHDRALRGLLGGGASRYFTQRPVRVQLVSDVGRRTGAVPLTIGNGTVTDSPAFDGLTVSLIGRDAVGAGAKWHMETRIPKKTITRSHFPNAPTDTLGLGIPICFGSLSAGASSHTMTGPDPTPFTGNTDKLRGAKFYGPADGGLDAADYGTWPTGCWGAGFGEMVGPPAPTNLSLSEVADAGADLQTDAHSDRTYYALITSVDADGKEGNPNPFPADRSYCPVFTLTGAGYKLRVHWTPEATAAKYRVYIGWHWYGIAWTQYIETVGTTDPDDGSKLIVDFTKNYIWGTWPIDESMITPGAHFPFGAFAYYTVTAIFGDGETALPNPLQPGWAWPLCVQGVTKPYRRKTRIEWYAQAGALEYHVYRMGTDWQWTRRWSVPATQTYGVSPDVAWFDDDWLDTGVEMIANPVPSGGAVPTIYVGTKLMPAQGGQPESLYHVFLVCGHAVEAITHWHYKQGDTVETDADEGVVWWIPGQAHWADLSLTPYVDLVGVAPDTSTIRCTLLYGKYNADGSGKADKAAAGNGTLTVDVLGWEDNGNGSGDVVEDLHLQCLDFLNYFVIGDGTGIRSALPPMIPGTNTCQVNGGTFRTLAAMRQGEIAGGIVGGGIVGNKGERITVAEVLKRFMESGEFRLGPNKHWQIVAKAIDRSRETANLPILRDDYDIQKDAFTPEPKVDELENDLTYRHGYNWAEETWVSDNQRAISEESIANWQVTQTGDANFYFLRSAGVAAFVVGRRQLRVTNVPVYVTVEGSLALTNYDVGDYVKLTHYRGIGAQGWIERVLWIIGISVLPKERRVRLECLDITGTVGARYAGRTNILTGIVASYSFDPAVPPPANECGVVGLTSLFNDDFEDGEPLSTRYANSWSCQSAAGVGYGGGWGVEPTGTDSEKYYAGFVVDAYHYNGDDYVDDQGFAVEVKTDRRHALNAQWGIGLFELRDGGGAWNISLYHGIDGQENNDPDGLCLYIIPASGPGFVIAGGAADVLTHDADVFQSIRMCGQFSTWSGGVCNSDGWIDVCVDGVRVIHATGLQLTTAYAKQNQQLPNDWVYFACCPMGHADDVHVWIG